MDEYKQKESFEIEIIEDLEIDNLIENKRTLPKTPDNCMCVYLSGSFIVMFLIIVLIVILKVNNV